MFVYGGTQLLGVIDTSKPKVVAFLLVGEKLLEVGIFPTRIEASRAVCRAASGGGGGS